MIGVIDYGCGNMGSIVNMLSRTGHKATVIDQPSQAATVERLILPGVGAFDAGMEHLAQRGWIETLERHVRQQGMPLLGICLGMQLLLHSSEEGRLPGLGWISGKVVRFGTRTTDGQARRVPHMGWNTVMPATGSHLLADWAGAGDQPRFYFVHSYHAADIDPAVIAGTTRYAGEPFVSVIESRSRDGGTVMATQFHPEKSHRFGIALLKRFASLEP
jgi:glutamine amidotransferase